MGASRSDADTRGDRMKWELATVAPTRLDQILGVIALDMFQAEVLLLLIGDMAITDIPSVLSGRQINKRKNIITPHQTDQRAVWKIFKILSILVRRLTRSFLKELWKYLYSVGQRMICVSGEEVIKWWWTSGCEAITSLWQVWSTVVLVTRSGCHQPDVKIVIGYHHY